MHHGSIAGSGFTQSSRLLTPPPSPPCSAQYQTDSAAFYHKSGTTRQLLSSTDLSPFPYDLETWSSAAQYLDPNRHLEFIERLGSGAYGVVYLARHVVTHVKYAVKVLNKMDADGQPLDQRQTQFQHTEMRLHHQASQHPNVVSLLRILDTPSCTFAIMEYCPDGDLFTNITERQLYVGNDFAAKEVFLQILDAVQHCHRLGIYHRDLKPENILVTDQGRQVKLADFGLATTDKFSQDFGCGSQFYMSPECHDPPAGRSYYASAPNDIWSLGVILVNLTCGRNPWKSASAKDSTFRAYTEDRQFLKSILNLSDELNEILGMVFELDPQKRISLSELRERVVNCYHFTKTSQVAAAAAAAATLVAASAPYVDKRYCAQQPQWAARPSSPASSISTECSLVSEYSDAATTLGSDYDDAVESDEASETDEFCHISSGDIDADSWNNTSLQHQYVTVHYPAVESPKVTCPAEVRLPWGQKVTSPGYTPGNVVSPSAQPQPRTSFFSMNTAQVPAQQVTSKPQRPKRSRPAVSTVSAAQTISSTSSHMYFQWMQNAARWQKPL